MRGLAFLGVATVAALFSCGGGNDPTQAALSGGPGGMADIAAVFAGDGTELRTGSGAWACHAPSSADGFPECLDPVWEGWIDALTAGQAPVVSRMAFGYWLQGGRKNSNVEPGGDGPFVDGRPHVAILLPNHTVEARAASDAMLGTLPTQPDNGGPWVMWRDTPFVHIMVPVGVGGGG